MKVEIGQKVNVRHGTGSNATDCVCGDTTVVYISARTGSFTLANGYQFHKDGRGFASNNAMSVGPAVCTWNDCTLPYATRNAAFRAYRTSMGDKPVRNLELDRYK